MSIRVLPPVGQRLLWAPEPEQGSEPTDVDAFAGQHVTWLASGTAALALAIRQALMLDPQRREVLLPAYGCPDLVAACIHAGAQPRLVDCAPNEPGFDRELLRQACGPETAAVVAVNFLGIQEPLAELHGIASTAGAVLIEDCAQWFPEQPPETPVAARIVSFGRGKPVNLLGGGALLIPQDSPLPPSAMPLQSMAPLSRPKAWVFNHLLGATAYGLVSRLPGLELGATRYHPLAQIEAMDPIRRSLAPANVQAWLRRRLWRQDLLDSELNQGAESACFSLSRALNKRRGRLLRYPLLCADQAMRDRLLQELAPLGASPFYAQALADVEGVAALLTPTTEPTPQAQGFAARLLTLPLHDGVSEYHLRRMAAAVCLARLPL